MGRKKKKKQQKKGCHLGPALTGPSKPVYSHYPTQTFPQNWATRRGERTPTAVRPGNGDRDQTCIPSPSLSTPQSARAGSPGEGGACDSSNVQMVYLRSGAAAASIISSQIFIQDSFIDYIIFSDPVIWILKLTHLNKYFKCSLYYDTSIIQVDLVVAAIVTQNSSYSVWKLRGFVEASGPREIKFNRLTIYKKSQHMRPCGVLYAAHFVQGYFPSPWERIFSGWGERVIS